MKEVIFNKEKIGVTAKVSELMHENLTFEYGQAGNDIFHRLFTGRLTASIMSRMNETQVITVHAKPPTFWEWITRKPRSFRLEVKCTEVLKNPPALRDGASGMLYHVSEFKEMGELGHD